MAEQSQNPAVISISSHVTRGSVGNRSAVFALEAFGFPVWSVPTVLLPWHPGHGTSKRIVPSESDFSAFISDIKTARWVGEVGAVLTGYISNASQVRTIAELVKHLKTINPNIIYMCDPVIGDNDNLYVPTSVAEAIRDALMPLADVVSPNSFELGWLTESRRPDTFDEAIQMASSLPVHSKLVTSVIGSRENAIGTLYLDPYECWFAEHPVFENVPNGVGDLASAMFLARKLLGFTPSNNLQATLGSIIEILTLTASTNSNELTLAGNVASLLKPKEEIPVTAMERQR